MPAFRLFRPDSDPAPQTALTIRDVLALYMRHAAAQNLHTPTGRYVRQQRFELFCAECGDVRADEAKPYLLADFIDAQTTWKSSSTRRACWNFVRAAFNWALEGERIGRNPFRKSPYAEAERRPDMPDATLTSLAAAANKPFERALRFLRLTGCRVGELCAAVWPDVDLERGVWTIPKHKTRKSTGKAKVVALVPEAVELLRTVLAAGAPRNPARAALADAVTVPGVPADTGSGHIFLNTRGRPWKPNTLANQLRRLKARGVASTAASLHGIRHRVGTACVAAGAPIKLVAQQLGHASVRTTEDYYCDVSGEMDAIRAAVAKGLPRDVTYPAGNGDTK